MFKKFELKLTAFAHARPLLFSRTGLRGHLQTDFSTLNVIMTLTFEPPPPLTSHTKTIIRINTELMVLIKTHVVNILAPKVPKFLFI